MHKISSERERKKLSIKMQGKNNNNTQNDKVSNINSE